MKLYKEIQEKNKLNKINDLEGFFFKNIFFIYILKRTRTKKTYFIYNTNVHKKVSILAKLAHQKLCHVEIN